MKAITVALALAGVVGAASAQESIKDFTLGADLHEAAKKAEMRCQPSGHYEGEFCFNVNAIRPPVLETIAGVEAKTVILSGVNGKIGSIVYQFSEDDFPAVRAAFAEKYQKMTCSKSVIQNRMGASFDQVQCIVGLKGATLMLTQRDGKIDVGGVTLVSHEYVRAAKIVVKPGAKKDL